MKSTIRCVAAIALSTVCVNAAFAVTPTLGERNYDLINSWFMPASEKAMPMNSQAKATTPTVTASKQMSDRSMSQTAAFDTRGSM